MCELAEGRCVRISSGILFESFRCLDLLPHKKCGFAGSNEIT